MPNDAAPRIPEKIKVFSIASFLNDFGAEMVFSVWPLFVTTFMGADLIVLGLLDGIGNMVVSLSQAASGFLSDRLGRRKPFIVAGYTLAGISKAGYALAWAWPALIPLRIMDRLGKIRDAPRDAEIADATSAGRRGASFGMLDAFDNAGAVAGIIAAFLLFGYLGYQKMFIFASIPPLAAAALIMAKVREDGRRRPDGRFTLSALDGNYRLFLAASAFLALGTFSYSFIIIGAQDAGFPAESIPLLYLALSVAAMLASAAFGGLADRFGRKRVMIAAVLLLVAAAFCISAGGLWLSGISFIAFGAYLGAVKPVQKTLASDLAPEKYMASALGSLQLVGGLAALPASLIVGFLWEGWGGGAAMAFSLVMVCISVILLLGVRERRDKDIKP